MAQMPEILPNEPLIPSIIPTTFPLFPLLPTELRLKIYAFALTPSLIKILPNTSHWRNPYATSSWSSPLTPLPITLHISSESRHEALKTLCVAFGSPFCPSKIYINFAVDTVRLGNGPGVNDINPLNQNPESAALLTWPTPTSYKLDLFLGGGPHGASDSEKIQRLVLDIDEGIYGRRNLCWDEIRVLTGLKELTLLVWEPDYMLEKIMRTLREAMGRVKMVNREWEVPSVMVVSVESGTVWGALEVPVMVEQEEE